ncbi:MAG: TDP-4-keto-6-deoxy-D-glucose transaminase [Bacteroidetes bacterium]|nr:MAG: TDP-4-keto-6-deoxy-D-glucose transaminase [Bacteroidota bacterium]
MPDIPFNKPFTIGNEVNYILEAVRQGHISGDGIFTRKSQQFFEQRYGFGKALLTTSCTDALEMAALLAEIGPGDEVIVPSFTFVSTANACILRGAKIVFADCLPGMPNLDIAQVESLISSKTKVVIPVHYAGVACDMDPLMRLAEKNGLLVVEDAAHAIDAKYKGTPLGKIGQLSTFSFHETKNIISGEGGMLVLNDPRLVKRAEIIREKGTNRAAFFRGEIAKYEWVDVGSSFLPSELTAAFLFAQLEYMEKIQVHRIAIWNRYYERLKKLETCGAIRLPVIPGYAECNGHLFYLVCESIEQRTALQQHLRKKRIQAVFHYQPLHNSPFFREQHDGRPLPNTIRFSDCLLRLPLFYELPLEYADNIAAAVEEFFQ